MSNQQLGPTGRGSPQINRIGPYALGKTLGVGSTGRVKLGTHIETTQKVAIKIIPKDALSQQSDKPISPEKRAAMNKKIEREITIMKLIQHPNVMQLYDVYETEKELFLILEHIEGGELFDYLVKKGRLSENEALMFFQQIIFGVEFCHKHLICHRDLKPENLLLDNKLNVKIADFGMASIQGPGRMLETSCGSPHYASPEIIKGIKYDGPAADIWSCGVILYALLTGNLPFDDENIRKLLSKVKSGMYFIPEHVSPNAKDLIRKMLVIDPLKRITMKGVMNHVWFTSQEPKNGETVLPGALETPSLLAPISNISLIDIEILNSLNLLGWGEQAELISMLTSQEPNTVKVFYNLLSKRKYSFMENYDMRKSSEWDIEGGPRHRTYSYNSLLGDKGTSRIDIYDSKASMLALPNTSLGGISSSDLTKRKSIEELREFRKSSDDITRSRNSSEGKRQVPPPLGHSQQQQQQLQQRRNPSPLTQHTSSSAAEQNNATMAPSPTSIVSPTTEMKLKLKISIPENNNGPTAPITTTTKTSINTSNNCLNNNNNNSNPQLTQGHVVDTNVVAYSSPKFHRKKQEVPPTPLITSPPKRSWFATLLNFKPETYILSSSKSHEETMDYIANQLRFYEVKFQAKKDGYKCKYEGGCTSTNNGEQILNSPCGSSSTTNNGGINGVGVPSSGGGGSLSPMVTSGHTSPNYSSAMSPTSPTSNFSFFGNNNNNNHNHHNQHHGNGNGGDIIKSVKFKIDVSGVNNDHHVVVESSNSPTTSSPKNNTNNNNGNIGGSGGGCSTTRVHFVQQQGAFSSFQIIVNSFKADWAL